MKIENSYEFYIVSVSKHFWKKSTAHTEKFKNFSSEEPNKNAEYTGDRITVLQ